MFMTSRRAAALVCALHAVVSGAGCSLVLSFDDPVIDASLGDGTGASDGPDRADGAPDPYEPNDMPTGATAIEPGTLTGLSIAPDTDVDYFSFTTPGSADVSIDVLFTHALGDIDVRLFNSTSPTAVGASAGEQDNEHITLTGAMQPPAGTYYINVYSALGENTYDLTLSVVGGPPPIDAAPVPDTL
jgi:hypothetical protein